jgi:hypothetical protein
VLSLAGVSLAIVGCSTPAEVDHNAQIARRFAPFAESRLMELETRTRTGESRLTYYKSE